MYMKGRLEWLELARVGLARRSFGAEGEPRAPVVASDIVRLRERSRKLLRVRCRRTALNGRRKRMKDGGLNDRLEEEAAVLLRLLRLLYNPDILSRRMRV